MEQRIILASSSPRRKRLLKGTGLNFEVIVPKYNEDTNLAISPRTLVRKLSEKKALDVARRVNGGIVIGADTILVCNGQKLGKPKDEKQAFRMLKLISGRSVDVYSGVTVIDSKTGKRMIDSDKSTITIRKLSEEEIRAYIRTKEPLDKAGAIAIQGLGAKFVSRIDGSASNVIGLPLECLRKNLRKFGVDVSISERWNI